MNQIRLKLFLTRLFLLKFFQVNLYSISGLTDPAILNMEKFLESLRATFRCCCLQNQCSGCLKLWVEALQRKKSVILYGIYFWTVRRCRLFHGLTKFFPSTARKGRLRSELRERKIKTRIWKERRRKRAKSKYNLECRHQSRAGFQKWHFTTHSDWSKELAPFLDQTYLKLELIA